MGRHNSGPRFKSLLFYVPHVQEAKTMAWRDIGISQVTCHGAPRWNWWEAHHLYTEKQDRANP